MRRHLNALTVALGLTVLVSGFGPVAYAQPEPNPDLSPRIVLVFDTSGSMGVSVFDGTATGGDTSEAHPGDGRPSRLFEAKAAVSGLVATTSEVQFALLRYPQVEGLGINRGAIDGFQQNQYTGLAQRALNYGGACDGVLDAPPAQLASTATALLVPFAEPGAVGNEPELVRWLDQRESWPQDRELRADGPTPLVAALRLAGDYLERVLPTDPLAACRRYQVVLLTDGGESCVAEAQREAALVAAAQRLRALTVLRGGANITVDVRTFVVAFGVNQNAAETLTGLARAAGTAVDGGGNLDLRRGGPYRAADRDGLRVAFSRILRAAVPVEVCDGVDDDCDGRVDEGALNACGLCGEAPAEVCNARDDDCDGRVDEGALNACGRCGPLPAEVCNARDDDCDGLADEGLPANCVRCVPGAEDRCNGIDDDCDGHVDNVPGTDRPLDRPCGRAVGTCTEGRQTCAAGIFGACDGVPVVDEACDGLDNDCDGATDEADLPCGVAAESGARGECRVGRRRCDAAACVADVAACAEDGWLVACEGAIDPAEETCNGRDDDCDGAADEQLFNACGFCGPPPPETCDGRDNTCDGRVDEDATCPPRHRCLAGECVQPCDFSGECAAGLRCVVVYPGGAFCHPDRCAAARCAPGTRCDPEIGACVDPCVGVTCAANEACDLGACVPATCRHLGCGEGLACRGDTCVPDLCAGVSCADTEFCRADPGAGSGACVRACAEATCAIGETCVDGRCAPDACDGRCVTGQRCDPSDGACVADPCLGVACPVGTACNDGTCDPAAPCVGLICPAGTYCIGEGHCTDGRPPEAARPPPRDAGILADAEAPTDGGLADGGQFDAAATLDAAPGRDAGTPHKPGADGCATVPGTRAVQPLWLLFLLAFWRPRRGARVPSSRGRLLAVLGLAAVLAPTLWGCSDEVGAAEATADAATDAARPDVGVADFGSTCLPDPEVCNGRDDDCDGLVDAADPDLALILLSDGTQCGACDVVCGAPAAEVVCQGGRCTLAACAPGFTDFNGELSDGCEAACVVTAGGVERCDTLDNDCDGAVDEDTDFDNDLANCGACGTVCSPGVGGDAICSGGRCGLTCLPGQVDLDGLLETGCEYTCEARPAANTPEAPDPSAGTELCNGLDDDCDGLADEVADLVAAPGDCLGLGVCAPQCGADVDCAPGERCLGAICLPEDGGPTDLSCTADADCQVAHPNFGCLAVAGSPALAGGETARACQPRGPTPQCDGDRGTRCLRPVGWRFGDEAGLCDGTDNDCDGRLDEDFAASLLEADRQSPVTCAVGVGRCQRAGVMICGPDGAGAVCSATAGAPAGGDDQCDGIDDDCDGRVDEAFVGVAVAVASAGGATTWIDAYEASRPGASAQDAGRTPAAVVTGAPLQAEARACSRAGVLPWSEVTRDEAQTACAAAGGSLCAGEVWGRACGGPGAEGWPYGSAFVPGRCNDGTRDADAAAAGQQSAPWASGFSNECNRLGARDLAGNLKEWTADSRAGLVVVRGGSFQTRLPEGLRCDQSDDLKPADLRHPALGFRCCYLADPAARP